MLRASANSWSNTELIFCQKQQVTVVMYGDNAPRTSNTWTKLQFISVWNYNEQKSRVENSRFLEENVLSHAAWWRVNFDFGGYFPNVIEMVSSLLDILRGVTYMGSVFSCILHDSDVIIRAMASQITGVCSSVCSGADKRKHPSSASLAFVRWIPFTKTNNTENSSIWWRHSETISFGMEMETHCCVTLPNRVC